MRNLQFQDIFKVIRILKKAGLSKQARTIMVKAAEAQANNKELDVKQLGLDFIFSILENSAEAEQEVYEFFAELKGSKPEEIKKMEFEEMMGMFEDFLKLPNLKGFFLKVSSMTK